MNRRLDRAHIGRVPEWRLRPDKEELGLIDLICWAVCAVSVLGLIAGWW